MTMQIPKFIRRYFKIYRLEEVFTPNTAAKLTYVSRNELENTLNLNLSQIGRCIVLYGESGSGKTTLIRRQLKEMKINYVMISCNHNTSYETIIQQVIDRLDIFYVSKKTTNRDYRMTAQMTSDFKLFKNSLTGTRGVIEGNESTRVIAPQFSAQRIAKYLGNVHSVLVLEDFHKVSEEEKLKIADLIKTFIDEANNYSDLKVLCIGAVNSPRELIKQQADLEPRLSELRIPLLDDTELKKMVELGAKLLNIKMSETLVKYIVFYSNNIASLAHKMCFDICYSSGVTKTQFRNKYIDDDKFYYAIQSFINSNTDSLSRIYELCTKKKIGWYILKTMTNFTKPASINEIRDIMIKKRHDFPLEEIRETLQEMTSEQMKILRYDVSTEKFSISSPFWGAFLRTQLAMEQSEKNRLIKNKRNLKFRLLNIDEDSSEVELSYLNFLKDQNNKQ
jgi:Cdc6-like AAA superfamily ATPase